MDAQTIERAKDILAQDNKLISKFWQDKYKAEAHKNWDKFYKRNTTNFFRDRHWTEREFEDLKKANDNNQPAVLLEIGCGVGNFVWPLLDSNPNLHANMCDFSPRAIDFVKVLKPGGKILFRDYALYDAAQLRFKPGHKLEEGLYVRQDGTLAYYFTKEFLNELFVAHGGLVELDNDYVRRQTTNAKLNISLDRLFLQAKFQKPE
ncbi:hypothetical protein H4219_001238 [Mycoemilia scoparia]|uniref:Methyltransferase-like protein n=1 Tax=Mycoemilia scoparia TaxID=417184 RepID=A0A9W8A3W6_9FUNG|nr:hypothetical protein H4219_001238 [Mycoemilia scoparia]